jgi:outer membrane receptor for ferrienterochelin and colicin
LDFHSNTIQKPQILSKLQTSLILEKSLLPIIKAKDSLNRITSKAMESQNKMEVSKALNMLPRVSLTASGPRNESMVSVRGLDAGLNNIFDRNYSLVEGYPEEGRIFL